MAGTENRIIIDLAAAGDLTKANQELDKMITNLEQLDRLTRQGQTGFAKVRQEIEKEQQTVEKNGTAYKALNGQLDAMHKAEVTAAQARKKNNEQVLGEYGKQTQALKDLRKELQAANDPTKIKQLSVEIETLSLALRQAKSEAKLVAEQNNTLENSYRGLELRNQQLRKTLKLLPFDDTSGDLERLQREFKANNEALKRFDTTLGQSFRNVGNYEEAIRNAAASLQNLGGGLGGAAGILGGGGGGGLLGAAGGALAGIPQIAAVAGILSGFQAVLDVTGEINKELAKTAALTELEGTALQNLTANIRATSATFNQEYNETLRAANALVKSFGTDFETALKLINKGLLEGADINGDFLDQLREYPQFFEEAGLSAQNFINVSILGAKEGIFSDKLPDAVKEASIRLKELTPATRSALKGIGLVVDDIERGLRSGTLTMGQLIADVSERLGELPSKSTEVGTAIADIFGGPGEDATLRGLLLLKDINKEIDFSTDKLNRYQQQQVRQLEAQQALNDAQVEFSRLLEGVGNKMGIFTDVALAGLIKGLNSLLSLFVSNTEKARMFGESIASLNEAEVAEGVINSTLKIRQLRKELEALTLSLEAAKVNSLNTFGLGSTTSIQQEINRVNEEIEAESENLKKLNERIRELENPTAKLTSTQKEQINQYRKLIDATRDYKTALSPEEVDALTRAVNKQNDAAEAARKAFEKYKKELKEIKELDFLPTRFNRISGIGQFERSFFEALFGESIEDAVEDFEEAKKELKDFGQGLQSALPSQLGKNFSLLEEGIILRGKRFAKQQEKEREELEKTAEIVDQVEQNKRDAIQATFDLASELVFSLTDIRLNRLDAELEALNAQEERKLAAVKDNEQARASIQAQFEDRRKQIQREQAKAEKSAAIFSIAINTARAVVAALATVPPNVALSIIVGAIGAAQIAVAASRPIPQFFKGTQSSPEGLAWLGEKGFEAVRAPGQSRYYLTNDGPQLSYIPRGTEVVPHERTVELMQQSPEMFKRSLSINNRSVAKHDAMMYQKPAPASIDYDKMYQVFKKALSEQPKPGWAPTEHGFRKWIQSGQSRIDIVNKRNDF